jgi:predicted amidohydrolase
MKSVRVGICTRADMFKQRKFAATLASLDILLLPELLDGGYAALRKGKPPHTFNDSFFSSFRLASQQASTTIIAGSTILRHKTSRPTNSSIVISRGKLVHRYDKIHLFKPCGDTTFFERGTLNVRPFSLTVRARKIRAGVIICYDRNERTADELDRHGYEIVRDEDLLLGRREIDPRGGRKYAIQLSTTELARARGGPRCMTMPLVRERLR